MLFESRVRVEQDVAYHSETFFNYLDRSARPEMGRVRDLLEEWFAHYPNRPAASTNVASLREKLRGQFRSRRKRQQIEAFWELYLHESLVRAGAHVTVRSDTPDFDVEFEGGHLALEATVRGLSDADTGAEARVQVFRDAIDRVQAGEWILDVCVQKESSRPPKAASLCREVEAWVQALDVDAVRENCEKAPSAALERLPMREFSRDGWHVQVRAIPKRKGVQRTGRLPAIGVWGGAVVQVSNSEAVASALAAKASRLRAMRGGRPLIVAVLVDREFADEDDIEEALFGSSGLVLATDARGAVAGRTERAGNGLWSPGGRAGGHIDAVLAAVGLDPCRVAGCAPMLWTNPSRHQAPLSIPRELPWNQCWHDVVGRRVQPAAVSAGRFFGISEGWPME